MFTAKTTGTPFANQPKDTYFNNNVLLLHGDNIIGANNSVFLNNITGNTYTPLQGTYSTYFNGNTDLLSVAASSNYLFGTNNFTIELWAYPLTNSASRGLMASHQLGGEFQWFLYANGSINFDLNTDNGATSTYSSLSGFSTTSKVSTNQWTHLAAVRNGNNFNVYVNGIADANTLNVAGVTVGSFGGNKPVYIGSSGDQNTKFPGYISNVRINNGTAIYTGNFTPPSSPLTTTIQTGSGNIVPFSTGTTLLTCQSPFVVDNAVNATITSVGSPAISAGAGAISRVGGPLQGSFSPFSTTGWSYLFNTTTTDFVVASSVTAIGTSDFTFECWINPTTYVSSMIGGNWSPLGGNTGAWQLTISATGLLQWQIYTDNNTIGTITIPTNKWTHVAISRINGTVYQFVNGVLDNIGASSINITNTGLNLAGATGGTSFNGYISNARLIIGTGLYNIAFTPSNAPLINISNTALLTATSNQFVGSNTTVSNVAITNSGNTSVLPFSPLAPTDAYSKNKVGGSIYFNGSTDRLALPNSTTGLQFGSSDFTIEFFMYNTSSTSTARIINNWQSTTATAASWEVLATSTGVNFNCSSNGTAVAMACSGPGTISLNTWNHVAAVRNGNIFSLYVNGTLAVSNTQTITLQTADTITVGARNNLGTYAEYFNGYLSNIRVIKGNALYTSNFTPPTSPLTPTANTTLLLNATNAGIIDNTQKVNLLTSGGVITTSANSKYGSSMYFPGTSYLRAPNQRLLNLATGNSDFTVECWFNTSNSNARGPIVSKDFNQGISNPSYAIYIDTGNKLSFLIADASSDSIYTQFIYTGIANNVWYHTAMVRSGSTLNCFLNGNLINTQPITVATKDNGASFDIGTTYNTAAYFVGYLDDIRITKGIARYTAPFIPPVRQHPNR